MYDIYVNHVVLQGKRLKWYAIHTIDIWCYSNATCSEEVCIALVSKLINDKYIYVAAACYVRYFVIRLQLECTQSHIQICNGMLTFIMRVDGWSI